MSLQKFTQPYKPRLRSTAAVEHLLELEAGSLAGEIGHALFAEPSLSYAYIGGSIADGFANRASDLDVYAVYDARIPPGLKSSFQTQSGFPVQIAATTVDSLSQNTTYLNAYEGTIGDLEESRLQFFHRFGRGIALHGERVFREQQAKVDWVKFKGSCSAYSQFLADNNWEDAAGNLSAGNLDTALLMAAQAVGNALDAVSALHGETAPGRKWRYDKAKRSLHQALPEVVEQCFDLETAACVESDQSKLDFLRRCEVMYSGLSDARVLLGLGYETSQLPAWLFVAQRDQPIYLRSGQSLLRRTLAGTHKMWSRSRGMEDLTCDDVLCWTAARGSSSLEELRRRIGDLTKGLGRQRPIEPLQLRSSIEELVGKGHLTAT